VLIANVITGRVWLLVTANLHNMPLLSVRGVAAVEAGIEAEAAAGGSS
jgi:hypothetical protein